MLRSNSSVKKTKKHGVIYLSKQGPEVTSASADELEIRRISGIFSFSDPDGNRFLIELGWGGRVIDKTGWQAKKFIGPVYGVTSANG